MSGVMPTQVVRAIDHMFPDAQRGAKNLQLNAAHGSRLTAVLDLVKQVPQELLIIPVQDYADLIWSMGSIAYHLEIWISRGPTGAIAHINEYDPVTVIRRVMIQCPDEYPPPATIELLFISDAGVRNNIRQDVGATNRALSNSEWKAATVLGGASIEALLHWRLQQSPPADITRAGAEAVTAGALKKAAPSDLDYWGLNETIAVAAQLKFIKPDTVRAAKLAQDFRNLIHPGRSTRLSQICDRATALSAVAALEHVIRDLS